MAAAELGEEKPDMTMALRLRYQSNGKESSSHRLRGDQLKKKLQISQESLQRSPNLDLP
uniref:Uncharacterized protein n=1 Tax=Equus asinus TaxID=9793 RepID=A0A9L0IEJ7_EQUAS